MTRKPYTRKEPGSLNTNHGKPTPNALFKQAENGEHLNFGRLLREYRLSAGLTQSILEKRIGYNSGGVYIGRMEKGRSGVPLWQMGKIISALLQELPNNDYNVMLGQFKDAINNDFRDRLTKGVSNEETELSS